MTRRMSRLVTVIDYGSGNLRSVAKALERAAQELATPESALTIRVTSDRNDVTQAERIVLPGVGAFADCWRGLNALPGMVEALTQSVITRRTPFLGICVGMQLMAEHGLEHGACPGLGWLKGSVTPMTPDNPALKIPHVGWNEVALTATGRAHPLLATTCPPDTHAYFVHSYAFSPHTAPQTVLATADHGGAFPAIVGRDNLIGTQFHPEKSQTFGLGFLSAFLRWRP